jgi:lipopolysaccharide/colanic/teichoic acid biosynthesis glycosyltransferase
VILRGSIIYIKNFLNQYYPILFDLIILNLVLFFTFWARFEYKDTFQLEEFFNHYIIINILASATYIFAALFFDLARRDNQFREKIFKVLFTTFLFVAALTAFLTQFAFSRLVVLITAVISTILMIGWRIIFNKYNSRNSNVLGKQFIRKRSLIVGDDKATIKLLEKITGNLESGIDIAGVVTADKSKIGRKIAGFEIVASLDQLNDYVRIKKIGIIIFSTHNISYETILKTMTDLHNSQLEFKMVPGHLEYMIGKSTVERFDAISLPDIQYAYGKPFNKLSKRLFDFGLSSFMLFFTFPVLLLLGFSKKVYYQQYTFGSKHFKLKRHTGGFGDFVLKNRNIWRGYMSFIGAPLNFQNGSRLEYKPGLTGIIQVNKSKILSAEIMNNFEIHYLKNQSFFLDMEILITAIFSKQDQETT